MTKRKTKQDKLAEAHTAYTAAKQGQPPKRPTRDVATRPTVSVPLLDEAAVLAGCLKWLKARRVFCNRHDCGQGPGHAIYGIKHSGDIHGILPGGQHFEIECKRGGGGRLNKGQQKRMADVRAAGGVYLVAHGVSELAEMMSEFI